MSAALTNTIVPLSNNGSNITRFFIYHYTILAMTRAKGYGLSDYEIPEVT